MGISRLNTFIVVAAVYILSTLGSERIGVSMQQANNKYFFSAGTNMLAVILAPILLAFIFVHRPIGTREIVGSVVPLWRRFAAFIIDFLTALLPLSAILALPEVLMEWHHTGTMAWEFSRDFSRPSDSLFAFGTVVPMFVWLIFYFAYPLTKGNQTIGQYVLGYRIAMKDIQSIPMQLAVKRVIISFIMMCVGWVSVPVAFFNKQKHMFHDSADGLRPELVNYKK